jgi:hypothetical protein
VEIAKVVKEVRRFLADPDCLEEDRDKDVGGIKKETYTAGGRLNSQNRPD